MSVDFSLNGKDRQVISYSITEEATPRSGGDSSGAVASFEVTIPSGSVRPTALNRSRVTLTDDQYGSMRGYVDSAARSDDGGTVTLQCISLQGGLAVYNVTAPPMSGTLGSVVRRYMDLGDPTLDFAMEVGAATRVVAYIGWTGELWYHLKMLAVANGLEVSFSGNVVTFRTPGEFAISDEWREKGSANAGDNDTADAVEGYWYKTSAVTNGSVYPPHRDLESVGTQMVPAGVETEFMLELATSLTSVQQPVYRERIASTWFAGSNISLMKEDGTPVTVIEWDRGGGAARVEIQDDPSRVKLIVRGPTNVLGTTNFRMTTKAGVQTEYSSLRLQGSGVHFDRRYISFDTGVTPGRASSEMAPTYDNIFVTDLSRASDLLLSFSVSVSTPKLDYSADAPRFGRPTYLGQVQSARLFDEESGHFFRTRQAKFSPSTVSISSDYDTRHSDLDGTYAGMTYDQVQAKHAGKTYAQVMMEGIGA